MKRTIILSILLNLCLIFNIGAEDSLPKISPDELTPQKIYEYAQDRNGKAMAEIREYLDIKDDNGNTALCLAQQNKDRESFRMLLVFGASKDVDCYDNTDTICAIIVGEKLKINGAGWLLGAAATAGAIYGASELLNNKKCPADYSVQYQSVADCGIHPEGWIYDYKNKDEHGKKCGRCIPKTYDTGCTTLWQTVNDCGEHPEGWNFESSGYSGDEVCGICTPKLCNNRESTSVRGENIRYTDIKYCPHRQYMRPDSQEQTGWSGIHSCCICNYVCDETTGFAEISNCEKNAHGYSAYNCSLDVATQCYYHSTPKSCPTTDTTKTKGASTIYATKEKCPPRQYMIAENTTANAWHGEAQCYDCNYKCDETSGFDQQTNCQKNASNGDGYICAQDAGSDCYYHSTPKSCPTIDTPKTKGASTIYATKEKCPFRKYMVAESVTANGWHGEAQCYNCNYKCDEKNGFATEIACKTNASGAEGYFCQLDAATLCYYRSQTPTPDNPTAPEKPCPDKTTYKTIGASTFYTNTTKCPPINQYMTVVSTVADGNFSGEDKCYVCNYECDEKNGFKDKTVCETNTSGKDGFICTQDTISRCYYRTDVPECPIVSGNKKAYGGNILYTDKLKCPSISKYMTAVSTTANGWKGDSQCFVCNYECNKENGGFISEDACQKNAKNEVAYICEQDTGSDCYYHRSPKSCPTTDTTKTKGASTTYVTKEKCPPRQYMIAESTTANGWHGEAQCYDCNYKCDETSGFATETACQKNAEGQVAYTCAQDAATGCYYHSTPKSCPTTDTTKTKGASTIYATKEKCPFRQYMVIESVTPNNWSGEAQCYDCNYKCDETSGFATETACQKNDEGQIAYTCAQDAATGCYYHSSDKQCEAGYNTAYQSVANCVQIGGTEDGWTWEQKGWSGGLKCGKCTAKSCATGSTSITNVSSCPTQNKKIAVAVQASGYAGAEACNECIYWCDPAQGAFATKEICEMNSFGHTCTESEGCYAVKNDCPEGYFPWVKNCNDKLHQSGWNYKVTTSSSGERCGKCEAKNCSSTVENVNDCGSTGDKGWKLSPIYNEYHGDEPCYTCAEKTCGYRHYTQCYDSNYADVDDAIAIEDEFSGDKQCYQCSYTCNVNAYTSRSTCEESISDDEIGIKYCDDGGTGCWIKVKCNSTNTLEDITSCVGGNDDLLKSLGIVSFKKATRKGECNTCIYDCSSREVKGENGYKVVNNRSDCSGNEGWTVEFSFPSCYFCKANQPSVTCVIVGDEPDNDACWNSQCGAGSQGGDDKCSCPYKNHSYRVTATNEKIGGQQCWICAFPLCGEGLTDDKSKGGEAVAGSCAGGSQCYVDPDYNAPAMMTMLRNVVNNQTLVIEHTEGDFAGDITINAEATVPFTDEETGETYGGSAVGSITLYNSAANADVAVQSGIRNLYNAKALGGEESNEVLTADGMVNLIMREGAENTTGYGLKTKSDAYNAYAEGNSKATGLIDITDTEATTNIIYGIEARRNAYNAFANGELAKALGSVNIKTKTDIAAYGIHAGKDIYNPNESVVNVTGIGNGELYGLYSKTGSVYNSGDVNVHAAGGNAYGIYVAGGDGQIIDNSGKIIVASDTKTAYGIYVENGGSGIAVTNSGIIIATGDDNSRGIKVIEGGKNVRIDNSGRIIVNGSLNDDNTAIDLNGGILSNTGEIIFLGAQNLDTLDGTATVAKGGSYKADTLKGNLTIDKSLVKEGFKDIYVAENAIQAEDIDGLNVTSQSAMFSGSSNKNNTGNYDAVATRRDFKEFTPNSSMRDYLEENYKQQRLEELYANLKDIESDDELKKQILRKTGADTLINLPQENISVLRSGTEAIADSVLAYTDEKNRIVSGADSFINDTEDKNGASGYDINAATAFMYGDKRLDNKNRLGLGLSYTQMSTSYDNGGDHTENFVSVFVPWLHKISDKLRLASILSLGYGNGKYDRGTGKEAKINDYIYGLTNKLIYSVDLGDIAELEPAIVLNAIGYQSDDMHDNELNIKGGNHLSVEAGLGAYLKKELVDSKYGKLTARLGGMYYRELADPYNKMRASFRGGVGSYGINDFAHIYNHSRAVMSAMLDYEYKRLALYIKYHKLIQRNKAQNFDMGIRYNF